MKLFTIAAAGLVALTGLAPAALTAPASAQRTVVTERTVVHTERHDRGYRDRVRTRQVCRNQWRHGHRVRVCRTVRYR
jgi:osmotically-inducible protein OsmY